MNRTFTLILALVVLIAHILAIHDTDFDTFGPPYEIAHVAFRLTRNVVWDHSIAWNPGDAGFDVYPSPAWLAIMTLCQRLYLGVNISQYIGIAAALGVVITASRFRPERFAGMIAPLLLIVNGGLAAAAASGTETALFTLEASLALLWFERRAPWRLLLACVALTLTRPEGAILVMAFFLLEFTRKRKERTGSLAIYLPAVLTVLSLWTARYVMKGRLLSPISEDMLNLSAARSLDGIIFLREFAISQGTPYLAVIPVFFILQGKLSRLGCRALVLALLWALIVILQGGASLPFAQAMVPALPFLFVAVQASFINALDARMLVRRIALFLLALSLIVGAMASRTPSNFAALKLEGLYAAWLGEGKGGEFGFERPMARAGLAEEIRNTRQLREIGIFMRDNLAPDHTIMTPWPGAIGYLTQLRVIDLFGRTHRWSHQDNLNVWLRPQRVDLIEAMRMEPDYIIFSIPPLEGDYSVKELAQNWLFDLDAYPDNPGRLRRLMTELRAYEMTTVPLANQVPTQSAARSDEYQLLRRRDLELTPRLDLEVTSGRFTVAAKHDGLLQVIDLRVSAIDSTGREWYVNPQGELSERSNRIVQARSSVLLYPSDRKHLLIQAPLPKSAGGKPLVRLEARLCNPGSGRENPFVLASDPVEVNLIELPGAVR